MNRSTIYYILVFYLLSWIGCPLSSYATEMIHLGDSVMQEVVKHNRVFEDHLVEFQGGAYLKGTTITLKSNKLYKLAPWAFPFDTQDRGSFFEMWGKTSYHRPLKFIYEPTYVRSTAKEAYNIASSIIAMLNMCLYTDNPLNNKYIIPGSPNSENVYDYQFSDLISSAEGEFYKIKYTPRNRSLKVISGYVYVKKGTPFIHRIDATGYLNIASFEISTTFRKEAEQFMLPSSSHIEITYDILRNVNTTFYHCKYNYDKIVISDLDHLKWDDRNKYDLTSFSLDHAHHVKVKDDDDFWDTLRQEPLSSFERKLLLQSRLQDSISTQEILSDTLKRLDYDRLYQVLVSNIRHQRKNSAFKYSGVINPSLLGYSKRDGIVIRQRMNFYHTFRNKMTLDMTPEVGFSFKTKEIFYGFEMDFNYSPRRLGNLRLEAHKGNQTFNSLFIESIEQNIDSMGMDFEALGIEYYRDYRFKIENSIELHNGLLLSTGAQYVLHNPANQNETSDNYIKQHYADFVPFIRLKWTPFQYYRYLGSQKVYMPSPCPTLSVAYAQGIKGVLNSNSQFKRAEVNIHHNIKLMKLRTLGYHVGIGGFFDQESEYFVDYEYFRRNTYPDTWNDPIGGVFNLIDSYYYYSAAKYGQVHIKYNSPNILLHWIRGVSKYILSESLYFSQLYTPSLPCYTELGYGVSNYIANIGIFTAFEKGRFKEVGFKATFELGKYW